MYKRQLFIHTVGHDPAVLQGAAAQLAAQTVRYLEFEVHTDLQGTVWSETQLTDVVGTVSGQAGIVGENNEDITVERVHLTGAPAIDVDRTSGLFSDITLEGEGSGTAFISHHGRSSDTLVVENLNITGYNVGVSLHSDPGEISAPLVLRNAHIVVSSALATEEFPVRMESCSLVGGVDVAFTEVVSVDGQVGTVSVSEGGEFSAYRTMVLDAQRAGVPVSATFTVGYGNELLESFSIQGTTVDVELLLRTITETEESVASEWVVQAAVSGSPLAERTVESPVAAPSVLVITVLVNQPPVVQLVEPYAGQRVMEGDFIRASAAFSDDMDADDDLVISWRVYDLAGVTVSQAGNEPVFNITDLTAGFYIVEVTVTDTYGEQTTASMDFEYTLLDTDNDWSSSCSSDTWFDPNTGKSCGPNIYDQDDDNDGFSDEKDAFPLDPCAQIDTDGDTQPDDLDCPDGFTSWLTEDMDDDNDGWNDTVEVSCGNDPLSAGDVPTDSDSDGVCDPNDAFPSDPLEWDDTDGDGVGDNSDAFPNDSNETADYDGDGIGDNADPDDDNDGWDDIDEVLCLTEPQDATSIPGDIDSDGICDALEQDLDNDGWYNANETI